MKKKTKSLKQIMEEAPSMVNVQNEFIIIDNPPVYQHAVYPYKNEWIVATLCEQGFARGKINFRNFYLQENDFILIFPDHIVDKCELSPDFKGKIVLISPHLSELINFGASFAMTKSVELKPYYVFPMKAVQAFRSFIELCKSLILLESGSNIMDSLKLLSKGFFIGIEELLIHQEPLPRLSSGSSSDLAEQFLNLVEVEYRQHRDLSFYANKLCKSVKYLSRVIMNSTGKNATDWIERCVVMDAKAQLVSTNKSIADISEDLHFPSSSFFGKYFKRVTGINPKDYRKGNQ